MSINKASSTSTRSLRKGSARSVSHSSKNGLSGPLVGKPWQEDFTVTVEIVQVERPSEKERRLNINFRVRARIILLALVAGVLGYAMYTDDHALIKDVLRIVETDIHAPLAAESPPRQR